MSDYLCTPWWYFFCDFWNPPPTPGLSRCDFCNRQFGSTFALVAHMETTHRDCNINTHEGCAKFLNNVTGGLVRVEGHLDDGSRRIVACQMQEVEIKLTPVAGHDLNNNPRGLNDAN